MIDHDEGYNHVITTFHDVFQQCFQWHPWDIHQFIPGSRTPRVPESPPKSAVGMPSRDVFFNVFFFFFKWKH